MSQELKQRYDYDWLDENQPTVDQTPRYHDFYDIETANQERREELTFFVQIFTFCLSTSLFSFLFLALNFPALLALVPASVLGAGLTHLVKEFLLPLP